MTEARKLTTILAADVAGYSRLTGVEEELTLARLRALRSDLIDPLISVHHGRVFKRTGDGSLIEFRSVVDAVRCAIEVQSGMLERNAGLPAERQIRFRVGIHLGDVVEESDGDLMGDGVNIAARLESICAPGAICLSEDAYRQVRSRLDLAIADLGNRELKNITEPVRVFSLEVGKRGQAKLAGPESKPRMAEPPRLSIVVLPFANIGGDPEQEYFVDGVTESLTTDMSRMTGSFVIGRNTAFTYKGKPIDLKQLGQELNVRYVLEGSVQRAGNRLRINVQLIDAALGAHLWAERFDKPIADLFDMQDEIVARLARQLDTALVAAEARRAEGIFNPDSTDWYFRGQAAITTGETPENYAIAISAFEKALALDPNNVDALAALSRNTASKAFNLYSSGSANEFVRAGELARRAIELAPNHAKAHMALAHLLQWTDRASEAITEYQRALSLDRNLAHAYAGTAAAKNYIGRAEDAEGHVNDAFRLSPLDAEAHIWCYVAGHSKMLLADYPAAEIWLRRGMEINRALAMPFFYLAGALAEMDRDAEVRPFLLEGCARLPNFNVRSFLDRRVSTNPSYLKMRERIAAALRRAGLPEG